MCVMGAWGSGSVSPDKFENMDGKIEHFNAIWNANFELQRQVKNKIECVFLHYLERFGIAKKILKTMKVNGAFWWYLKRFRTATRTLKTRGVNGAFCRYLKRIELQRKKEETRR